MWFIHGVLVAGLAATLVPAQAAASVFAGYSGTLVASAGVKNVSDVQSTIVDGFGTHEATANVEYCSEAFEQYCIGAWGSSAASGTLTLGGESFSASNFSEAAQTFSNMANSSTSLALNFLVLETVSKFLNIDAAGHFAISIYAEGESAPVYSRQSVGWPGDFYQDVIPLTLEAGAYQLLLSSRHFDSETGVISAGHLNVSYVPVPAAIWLFASALIGLGATIGRGSRRVAAGC